MNRRGFLGAMLAAAASPAIVRASSLMPIYTPPLVLWGDGIHDDTAALQALMDGKKVKRLFPGVAEAVGVSGGLLLSGGVFLVSNTITLPARSIYMQNSIFKGEASLGDRPVLYMPAQGAATLSGLVFDGGKR